METGQGATTMSTSLKGRSKELYEYMQEKGYPEAFSRVVAQELNTDISAGRMIGYLSYYSDLPLEEVVDEMLAIKSDRDSWIRKKVMENNNAAWNKIMDEGLNP